ncbi:hypothetical protein KIN20_029284 [Parelaphostrongylus tenuis]|uniref:Uncharacterized protein n=1 Tax=Parelaphostrongylus tenuis TaxID=148309 RepID=A0AAD5R2Y4_PARTN|nr:hypothetical protein KIN20_029284 [Parelaphostrongylus tenuis]
MLNWRGTSLSYNTRRATVFIVLMLLATFSIMLGCGVMPPGQASTRSFTVTGFTLPAAMVYSTEAAVRNQHPAIAASPDGAKAFVQRLVMQTVFSVLDSQGRSALLPDTIISAILGQLTVRISYEPLLCQKAVTVGGDIDQNKVNCIIVDDTVTGTCTTAMARTDVYDRTKRDGIICYQTTKHHHGELVESDVAKSDEQSSSDAGSGAT